MSPDFVQNQTLQSTNLGQIAGEHIFFPLL